MLRSLQRGGMDEDREERKGLGWGRALLGTERGALGQPRALLRGPGAKESEAERGDSARGL